MKIPTKTRVLFIGEGDFSFTLATLEQLKNYDAVFTTSVETEDEAKTIFSAAANNLKQLKEHQESLKKLKPAKAFHVYHEVDARSLSAHRQISLFKYDLILFNFPHFPVDPRSLGDHKQFLENFFSQAAGLLQEGGLIRVLLQLEEPYKSWNVIEGAETSKLKLVDYFRFNSLDYPGYKPKKGWGDSPNGDLVYKECEFYEFKAMDEAQALDEMQQQPGLKTTGHV